VITIDATGCQTAIAAQIVEGGGDYVLAVKDNPPQLAGSSAGFLLDPGSAGLSEAGSIPAHNTGQGTWPDRDAALHRGGQSGLA
jgi:hypothetical protein